MNSYNPFIQLSTNSIVYGVSSLLQRFVGLLLLPFFTEVLTTTDYGVLGLLTVINVFFVGVLNLGSANSIGLLYFAEELHEVRSRVIWSGVLLLIINCALILPLTLLIAPGISQAMFDTESYALLVQLSITSLCITVVADPFLAYLRMNNRAVHYVILNISTFLVTSSLAIWLILFEKVGLIGILIAQITGQSLLLLSVLLLIGKELPFSFDKRISISLVRIGFPSVIGSFATLFLAYVDRWFVKYYLGLDQLGIYSLGVSMGIVMALIVGAFDTAWPPFFASYINKRKEAMKVFPKVLLYYTVIIGVLILLFFGLAKPIVSLLLADAFQDAFLVVGLIAASQALYGAYSIMGVGIYFAKKLIYLSIIKWIGAVITIIFCILLTPQYGITGAAAAIFIGYLSLLPMVFYASAIELPLRYDGTRIFPFLIVLVILSSIVWLTGNLLSLSLNIVISLVAIASILIFVWFRTLIDEERSFLLIKLKQISLS